MAMENQHLVFMLQKLLPGSYPGKDYQVITQYADDGVTVVTEASIYEWNLPGVTQPTQETLSGLWTSTYESQYNTHMLNVQAEETARLQEVADNSLL